jgi:hypothetical protein
MVVAVATGTHPQYRPSYHRENAGAVEEAQFRTSAGGTQTVTTEASVGQNVLASLGTYSVG